MPICPSSIDAITAHFITVEEIGAYSARIKKIITFSATLMIRHVSSTRGSSMYAIRNKKTKEFVYATSSITGKTRIFTSKERLGTFPTEQEAKARMRVWGISKAYEVVEVKVEVKE